MRAQQIGVVKRFVGVSFHPVAITVHGVVQVRKDGYLIHRVKLVFKVVRLLSRHPRLIFVGRGGGGEVSWVSFRVFWFLFWGFSVFGCLIRDGLIHLGGRFTSLLNYLV